MPVDDRHVSEGDYTAADHDAATAAGEALREQILADPRGRAAYNRATADIEEHQRQWRARG